MVGRSFRFCVATATAGDALSGIRERDPGLHVHVMICDDLPFLALGSGVENVRLTRSDFKK